MSGIHIKNLRKDFGRTSIIENLSLEFSDGEFTSIIGPSGCGKTTLLRMIAGLEVPDAGEIWIGDHLVVAPARKIFVPPERRDIGMVFQSYAVWPHKTTFENVAFPLRVRRLPEIDIRRKVDTVLAILGLDKQRDRYPSTLSGGQQQRVALARAIVFQSRLLLLDEPLANLDVKVRETVRLELKELQRRFGLTTLYVTHDQSEALAISDTIVAMNQGRVLQSGTAWDLYHYPADAFVAQFVGQSTLLTGHVSGSNGNRDVILDIGLHMRSTHPLNIDSGKVVASVRPEDVTLIRDKPSPDRRRENSVAGVVRQTVFQGGTGLCIVEAGSARIQVQVDVASLPALVDGTAVSLRFDPGKLKFFSAANDGPEP